MLVLNIVVMTVFTLALTITNVKVSACLFCLCSDNVLNRDPKAKVL